MRRTISAVTGLILAGGIIGAAAPRAAMAAACSSAQGQAYITDGRYKLAIREFTCLVEAQPTEIEGYRGRIEAELLLGRFVDAVSDYARLNAYVLPVHPDAEQLIVDGYEARLNAAPDDIAALTGESGVRWWFFHYATALRLLDDLLEHRPNDLYGNLFRGSSRLLHGSNRAGGVADLERALAMAPDNASVHFLVADAYTYGAEPDPLRAFNEATTALNAGLDTPRIHAILATSYVAFGNTAAAAVEYAKHIELVTTQLVVTTPLGERSSMSAGLTPGRTYEIPLPATAGATISIATSSKDFYDTILVLLAPDGTPILGSDDYKSYFAGFSWVAPATGTYRVRVTSFESVNTGTLVVTRN